mmetsp:Transcript_45183/g.139402  ORF Transcript_45183/g.139402 Transcript_45183/m.139402 type:complete len:334 (+) Transcript_45183:163-1164(+)
MRSWRDLSASPGANSPTAASAAASPVSAAKAPTTKPRWQFSPPTLALASMASRARPAYLATRYATAGHDALRSQKEPMVPVSPLTLMSARSSSVVRTSSGSGFGSCALLAVRAASMAAATPSSDSRYSRSRISRTSASSTSRERGRSCVRASTSAARAETRAASPSRRSSTSTTGSTATKPPTDSAPSDASAHSLAGFPAAIPAKKARWNPSAYVSCAICGSARMKAMYASTYRSASKGAAASRASSSGSTACAATSALSVLAPGGRPTCTCWFSGPQLAAVRGRITSPTTFFPPAAGSASGGFMKVYGCFAGGAAKPVTPWGPKAASMSLVS